MGGIGLGAAPISLGASRRPLQRRVHLELPTPEALYGVGASGRLKSRSCCSRSSGPTRRSGGCRRTCNLRIAAAGVGSAPGQVVARNPVGPVCPGDCPCPWPRLGPANRDRITWPARDNAGTRMNRMRQRLCLASSRAARPMAKEERMAWNVMAQAARRRIRLHARTTGIAFRSCDSIGSCGVGRETSL